MLDTLRTVHPRQEKDSEVRNNKQESLYLLQKYAYQIVTQYESALLQFDLDQRQSNDIHAKLQAALNKLLSEKATLQRNIDDLLSKQQKADWENRSLQKKLTQQQEYLNGIRQQKEGKQDNEYLLREQNLKNLRQQQKLSNLQIGEQQTLRKLTLRKQQIQQAISILKLNNKQKRRQIESKSQKIDQQQQQNISIVNRIEVAQQNIQKSTSSIEQALARQNNLTKHYGELKRRKKDLHSKIKQITPQLKQEQNITNELSKVEHILQVQWSHIRNDQQNARQQIGQLLTVCDQEQSQLSYNKECLSKLTSYLQTLKIENQKIECYMENILEQDYHIKAVMDKKYTAIKKKGNDKDWQNTRSTMK